MRVIAFDSPQEPRSGLETLAVKRRKKSRTRLVGSLNEVLKEQFEVEQSHSIVFLNPPIMPSSS